MTDDERNNRVFIRQYDFNHETCLALSRVYLGRGVYDYHLTLWVKDKEQRTLRYQIEEKALLSYYGLVLCFDAFMKAHEMI